MVGRGTVNTYIFWPNVVSSNPTVDVGTGSLNDTV
jgi:hypothetical protein